MSATSVHTVETPMNSRPGLGPAPAPRQLTDEQRSTWQAARLPLPAARWRLDPGVPWLAAATSILAAEGLAWENLKIKGLRKPFFTKGERAAWCVPADLITEAAPDERNLGQSSLRLQFTLPRGSYATILVKQITGMSGEELSKAS